MRIKLRNCITMEQFIIFWQISQLKIPLLYEHVRKAFLCVDQFFRWWRCWRSRNISLTLAPRLSVIDTFASENFFLIADSFEPVLVNSTWYRLLQIRLTAYSNSSSVYSLNLNVIYTLNVFYFTCNVERLDPKIHWKAFQGIISRQQLPIPTAK